MNLQWLFVSPLRLFFVVSLSLLSLLPEPGPAWGRERRGVDVERSSYEHQKERIYIYLYTFSIFIFSSSAADLLISRIATLLDLYIHTYICIYIYIYIQHCSTSFQQCSPRHIWTAYYCQSNIACFPLFFLSGCSNSLNTE